MLFSHILKQTLKVFAGFAFFVAATCLFRCCSTEVLTFRDDWGSVVLFGFIFGALWQLISFSRKNIVFCFIFYFLYLFASFTKIFCNMILSEREIIHTLCVVTLFYAFLMILKAFSAKISAPKANMVIKIFADVMCFLFLLPCFVRIGYFCVNRAIFDADILLTLFQTNLSETAAYLADQNKAVWLGGIFLILILLGGLTSLFHKIKNTQKISVGAILLCLVLTGLGVKQLEKLNVNFLSNIVCNTYETLKNFKDYNENKNKRMAQIQKLSAYLKSDETNGIYILVIGESESRDHMSAYGYKQKTTPWLDKMAKNTNSILFSNAYSNHTHTIPTLSFSLSSANQYNHIELKDSYSIIELAKAAGFETYWYSNQPKDSVFITPVLIMASTADHELWLNSAIGDKLSVQYYDEQLLKVFDTHQMNKKSLVIVHLMGSHGAYRDRYPKDFQKFKQKNKNVAAYDNSILYTDYVLSRLYEKVSALPDFKAMFYFSDHGDDVDSRLGHESTRFTYPMARIPFVAFFSDSFIKDYPVFFETLKQNKDQVFTNDLIFDLMVSALNIKGFEQASDVYDLSSSKYGLTRENALTLHGKRNLKEDIK